MSQPNVVHTHALTCTREYSNTRTCICSCTGIAPFLTEKVAAKSAVDFVQKVQAVCGGDQGAGAGATDQAAPVETQDKTPVAAFAAPRRRQIKVAA